MIRWLGAGLLIALLAAGGSALWWRNALSPAGSATEAVTFQLAAGTTLRGLGRDLERAGLIRDARAFEWLGRSREAGAKLRAGEYALRNSWSAAEILDRIVAGHVVTYGVSLPEGLTAVEIAARVEAAGLADAEAFLAVVRDPKSPERYGVEGPGLEGYLFPETYQLARGLPVERVVGTLVEHFKDAWREVEPAAKRRGLSMREVTILASIVEKETGAVSERPLIASVFHNRIARGMRLETDPTVIYGIADFDGNLTRAHLDDASNPYNTYQIAGLPPGPIANPGAAALRAVVEPADAEFLFFVSRNDGTHVFSRSYREHVNAVNRFQRRR